MPLLESLLRRCAQSLTPGVSALTTSSLVSSSPGSPGDVSWTTASLELGALRRERLGLGSL